ncbi:MAG: hypothetical protein Fur0032_10820 [Terrimicrobiaceae bacterium]
MIRPSDKDRRLSEHHVCYDPHWVSPGLIFSDLLLLGAAATVALFIGLLLNAMQDRPLPFAYLSKAQRMEDSVARLSAPSPATPTSSAVPSPAISLPAILELEGFSTFVEQGQGVVLDARPETLVLEGF